MAKKTYFSPVFLSSSPDVSLTGSEEDEYGGVSEIDYSSFEAALTSVGITTAYLKSINMTVADVAALVVTGYSYDDPNTWDILFDYFMENY